MDQTRLNADAPQALTVDRFATPIGEMYAVADERGRLRAFAWVDHESRGIQQLRQQYGARMSIQEGSAPAIVRRAIDDYFNGDLLAIDRIECATNGSNPIAVVVPCHRVIGTDGSLTGYGGGLERKRWLLAHEGVKGVLGNTPTSLF